LERKEEGIRQGNHVGGVGAKINGQERWKWCDVSCLLYRFITLCGGNTGLMILISVSVVDTGKIQGRLTSLVNHRKFGAGG
jgi:hypothetical protein